MVSAERECINISLLQKVFDRAKLFQPLLLIVVFIDDGDYFLIPGKDLLVKQIQNLEPLE